MNKLKVEIWTGKGKKSVEGSLSDSFVFEIVKKALELEAVNRTEELSEDEYALARTTIRYVKNIAKQFLGISEDVYCYWKVTVCKEKRKGG